jgi:hypothetical protein
MRKLLVALAFFLLPTLTFAASCNQVGTADQFCGSPVGAGGSATLQNLQSLTKTDDTNVTLTLGGTPATALNKAVSLTLGWTGTLSVARGGTGLGVGISGGIPYYSSTSTIASSALLAANGFVVGGGVGVSPSTVSLTGLVLGNGASAPTAYAGVTCTNQFLRILSAAGVGTCATVGSADLASSLSLTTPNINVSIGTSLALNGATLGTNKLAVTGTSLFTGDLTVASGPVLGTVAGTSSVSATAGTFLYINATTAGVGALAVNGGVTFYWTASQFYPGATNTGSLGTAAAIVASIYGTQFFGGTSATAGVTCNAGFSAITGRSVGGIVTAC